MIIFKQIVRGVTACLLTLSVLSISFFPTFAEGALETAATYRLVSESGSDTGNCTTSACRSIQYAVNQSGSGDTILVTQGIFTYNAPTEVCASLVTRAIVCVMNKSLTISGGYAPNWSSRNPAVYQTIIDGAETYRGVAVIGYPATTYLDMEGFTIRNARALGSSSQPNALGGGMLIQLAYVTLRDMVFNSNRSIGSATSSGAGGSADGGAIRIQDAPAVSLLQRVSVTNNQSLGGIGPQRGGIAFGAVYIYNSNVTIEDSSFSNNLAQAGSSGGTGLTNLYADALGGGIAIQNSLVTLNRITVTGNQAIGGNASSSNGTGGGGFGGGIFVENLPGYSTSLTLTDSYVADNTATAGTAKTGGNGAGGGLDADSAQVTIERSSFISNTVTGGSSNGGGAAGPGAGGGLYLFAVRSGVARATLRNILIAENEAFQGSGNTNLGNGGGGGLVVQGLGADINHATFSHNVIGTDLVLGQAISILPWDPWGTALPTDVTLANSIISNHTIGQTYAAAIVVQDLNLISGSLTFIDGLFAANNRDTNNDNTPVLKGTINGLATMSSSSSAGYIASGNYHLRSTSSAKDQAVHSSTMDDIDNQDRPYPNGGTRDYGADEYYPFALFAGAGDSTLQVNWAKEIGYLEGGVDHYMLTVDCGTGAGDPDQVNCDGTIDVGAVTHFNLTGLTNLADYTITVSAYDASDALIAESYSVTATPSDRLNYLPLLRR